MARSDEATVELSDYLAVLRRRKLLILVATVLGLAAGLAYSLSRPSVYTSTAKVLVASPTKQIASTTAISMPTEQEIVESDAVAQRAQARIDDAPEIDSLLDRVEVSSPTESLVLYISYSAATAAEAQDGAQAFASSYISFSAPKEDVDADVIAPADLPTSPASPNQPLEAGIGAFLGLFIGVLLAFFRDRTDERIRRLSEVEAIFGVPVLAILREAPGAGRRGSSTPVAAASPDSREAAPFRTLAAAVARRVQQHGIRTLLITGVAEEKGAAVTAGNLAVVLAQSGRKVTLASGNVRSPRVHSFFGLPNEGGLASALNNGTSAASITRQTPVNGLDVLPSGPADSMAMVVQGKSVLNALADLASASDLVVLDSPALRAYPDGLTLAQFVDAVVLVVDASRDRHGSLTQAAVDLDAVAARVLGVVLVNSELNLLES